MVMVPMISTTGAGVIRLDSTFPDLERRSLVNDPAPPIETRHFPSASEKKPAPHL